MASRLEEWRVLDHGGIEKLNDRLWRVQGRLPGMTLRRTMTVAKRWDGGLVIHSAMALDEEAMRAMEAWGPLRFLLVPNRFHRMDAPRFKKRYPALCVLAPRGERAKIDKVVATDGSYEDFPPDEVVRLHTLPGTGEREGAMLVDGSDGVSVVLNDIMMNMDRKRDVLGFLITTLMGSAPGPRISRVSKAIIIRDRRLIAQELERLASLPNLARLIVSHEKVETGADAAARALRQAATYL